MRKYGKRLHVWFAVLFLLVCLVPLARAEGTYDCAAGRHKDVVIYRLDPTETEDGYEIVRCEICGREYEAVLYATGHIWGPWIVDKEPTCTEPGLRHRTCTRATPHDETEVIPALGHDYVLTATPPDCENDGVNTYTCSRCGDTYTEPGEPALGHDYVLTITPSDCEHDGVNTYVCSRCGDTYTEPGAPALGHDFVLTTIPPDCEHDGVNIYVCSRCGETYTEPGEAALGHDFGEWTEERPAAVGIPGLETRVCIRCGVQEEREIPALPVVAPSLFPMLAAVVGGADIGMIGLFALVLLPSVRTVNAARKALKERINRRKWEETEAGNHGFH